MLDEKGGEKEKMTVQFNPSELSIESSSDFSDDGGIGPAAGRKPQFVAERRSAMKLRLTFDGFAMAGSLDEDKAGDVNKPLGFLRRLVAVDEAQHRPPMCLFEWGGNVFMGYAESLSVSYTMFTSRGIPIRAVADISFKGVEDKRLALQSPDRTRRHVVTQGTPLYLVAYGAYNDPGEWRRIAEANGVKNPRKLRAGAVLTIPPLEPGPL
jgi:nucleoid-associated protein YgaU